MSDLALEWALSSQPKSTGVARNLLMVLAQFADENAGHSCAKTILELATCLEKSKSAVTRSLAQLEDAGDIAVRGVGGRGKANSYWFPKLPLGATNDRENAMVYGLNDRENAMVSGLNDRESAMVSGPNDRENAMVYGQNRAATRDRFSRRRHQRAQNHSENAMVFEDPDPDQSLRSDFKSSNYDLISDDELAAFRSELAAIVAPRDLTKPEMLVIQDWGSRPDGRRLLRHALFKLRAEWGRITRPWNCAGWLESVMERDAEKVRRRHGEPLPEPDPLREALDETFGDVVPSLPPPRGQTPAETLWAKTLGELKLQLELSTYYTWLHNTEVLEADESHLVIMAASQYARDWLENRLRGVVLRTLNSVAGRSIDVEFVIDEESADLPGGPGAQGADPAREEPERQAGKMLSPEGRTGNVANLDHPDFVMARRARRARRYSTA